MFNEDMKKNIKVIGYGLLVMVALLVGAPVTTQAQNMQFQSTSSMRGTGSSYTPQVTAVGSTYAASEATTTESYSPAKAPGMRKGFDEGAESDRSTESPIGDAVLPLMALAMVYSVWCMVYKRKREAEK